MLIGLVAPGVCGGQAVWERVEVITIRPRADNRLRNGALAEEQSITVIGRCIGRSHSASSMSVTSGPRRLNLASRVS